MIQRRIEWAPIFAGAILAVALWSLGSVVCANQAEPGHAATEESSAAHSEAGSDHSSDEADLTHANASSQLESPEEFKSDLAIYTFLVFLLLLLILAKFAWRPIMEGLEKREQSIASKIDEARLNAEKSNELLRQYEGKLVAATDEIRTMMADARRDAESAKERIMSEAQAAAKRERDKALSEISAAKEAALREMAQKSVDTAVALAGRIVRKQVTAADHARLIKESLDQFPSQN